MPSTDIPNDFLPLRKSSPFLDNFGPLYERTTSEGVDVGLQIEPRHTNNRSLAHGALLFSLADMALGMSIALASQEAHGLTVSMSLDFLRPTRLGDWVVARARVQHVGGTLGFASCTLVVNDTPTARASAVFHMAKKITRATSEEHTRQD